MSIALCPTNATHVPGASAVATSSRARHALARSAAWAVHTPASMTSAFADIADFLAQERIALIGASLDAKDVSRTVMRELIAAGYDVVPVNTRVSPGDHMDGRAAFAHVGDIARSAEPVAGALLMVPSNAAVGVVGECAQVDVLRVWFYRGIGQGVATNEAIRSATELGIRVVVGESPLMFLPRPKLPHRLHGALKKLFGRWPRSGKSARPARSWLVVLLAILEFLVGGAALVGGVILVADAEGATLGLSIGWLERSPFGSFVVPGLVLGGLGLGHIAGGLLTLRHRPNAGMMAAWLGLAMLLYVVGQWLWTPAVSVLQFAIIGIALAEIGCAITWLTHLTPPIRAVRAAMR